MNTDRWYYRVFQSAPDLIRALLPGSASAANVLGLDPNEPGDRLYRFQALEIKELSHRLAAQTYRFLQHHPRVEHWAVVVITPHSRLSLGPTQALQQFLQQVAWLNLEELSRRTPLDPLLNLLTLPIRPESDLAASSQQILASRPDLEAVVLPMLMQRLPHLTNEEIMVIAGIPMEELRHTRAAQDWLAAGREEGEAKVTLRLLSRRCGPLSETTAAQVQALPLEQLEALADALLDFQGPADLTTWLAANT